MILVKEDFQQEIELPSETLFRRLSGHNHEHLRAIAEGFRIRVGGRGKTVYLAGPKNKVGFAHALILELAQLLQQGQDLSLFEVSRAVQLKVQDPDAHLTDLFSETVFKTWTGKNILASGPGQKSYVKAIKDHDMVFGVGPAGTGKTYLAMTLAMSALISEQVSRVILTRPAVEAGEKLGFLPGSAEEKVLPYLRPLYDAMFDLVGVQRTEEWVSHGIIEVAPLAFMRGRTLNNAFVILDEAQNTTREQMKMFLTRLGFGSKMVITGDITQIDLAFGVGSGLNDAVSVLKNVEGVAICNLTERDVVRHQLVQRVVRAYEAADVTA